MNIRRTIGWAVLWVVVDGFVLAQFSCAVLCEIYALFYALPRALIAFKNRERRNYYLMRSAVFFAVPIVVGCIFVANLSVGERNAIIVIAAVDKYQAEQKRYPQTLQELVPKYLPEIPPTKYALSASEFRYVALENRYQLVYTTLPPFGRRVYDFTTHSWSILD